MPAVEKPGKNCPIAEAQIGLQIARSIYLLSKLSEIAVCSMSPLNVGFDETLQPTTPIKIG
jgi:hypothetical protein